MSEFSLTLVLRKEDKQNSNMTWQKYKLNLRNSFFLEECFQVGNFFNRFFKTDRHIVAVCLLSPLHILSITEPMTKPAMAPSTLCVWANPLKSPIHLINPIVVLILPANISVSHVIAKQITRNRPFPVLLGPVSAPVFPCFVAGCSLADAPRLRIHCPADGASLDIDKPQTG